MKKVKPKTGKCVGCGKPILENSVRCRSCASKYRMSRVDMSGDKNPNWDGGKTIAYCIDCGKRISKYHKRCKSCSSRGEFSSQWQGGISKHFCIDCGKPISQTAKRCPECWHKFNSRESNVGWRGGPKHCIDCGIELKGTKPGSSRERCQECHLKYAVRENASRWLGGIGKEPYPFEFDDKLKELIRERDSYTCQLCGKKQEDHYRKLDIHHIDYDKDNLNPNNLVTLCQSCHSSTNVNRKQWQDGFEFLQQMRQYW